MKQKSEQKKIWFFKDLTSQALGKVTRLNL